MSRTAFLLFLRLCVVAPRESRLSDVAHVAGLAYGLSVCNGALARYGAGAAGAGRRKVRLVS